jgi:hypothetical protein
MSQGYNGRGYSPSKWQEKRMEVYRNLYIHGNREQLAALVKVLERSQADDWSRNELEEMRMQSVSLSVAYCFSCGRDVERPAATVFLLEKEAGLFYVANILAIHQYKLTSEQYSSILGEFADHVIRPYCERFGLKVELMGTIEGLQN